MFFKSLWEIFILDKKIRAFLELNTFKVGKFNSIKIIYIYNATIKKKY